jgi:signal transduction histidine kinase
MTTIHVPLKAPASRGAADGPRPRSWASAVGAPWLALLRLPLLGKLAGANVLVALVAATALVIVHADGDHGDRMLAVGLAGLAVGVTASLALMKIALQPVSRLRATLGRFARGDAGVRVPPSLVADRDLLGVGEAVNDLLDDLLAERARVRQLARDTIRGADEERARIARGLHETTAQTLAALSIEARIALELETGQELTRQLELIKDLAVDACEEVRDLSHAIHPRVLDDLGLEAALGWLVRSVREGCDVALSLQTRGDASRVPREVANALFRIAQAALEGACDRCGACSVAVDLATTAEQVTLEVRDDGWVTESLATRLSSLGERLALSGGTLTMNDIGGRGLDLRALVPLGPEAGKEPS